jgi:outer membrane protein assembly factor BamB
MKKLTIVLGGLISILCATSAPAQTPVEQARAFQVNTAHTGSITSPGLVPPLRQKWSINFGNFISYPIIADGRVFVTVKHSGPLYDSRVYAIDAANGAIIWSFNLVGESLWSALTYENGRLFASTREGGLRAFNAATGTVIWTKSVGGPFTAPPTAFQGVVYLSGRDNVWAFSEDTGNLLWKSPVGNADTSSPVVTDDAVYVSYACPIVYKLNRANGAQIWSYNTGTCSGAGGKTAVLHNGRLYVRDAVSDYLFDSQTGSVLGTFSSPVENAPAFSGNMGFFLHGAPRFGELATLEGRDLSNNNALVWSFTGDGYLQSGLLVVNNIVYVGSDRGKLYGLDTTTGQVVWSTTAGNSIPYVDEHNGSRPTTGLAAAEGLLVIPTDTTLVAYEADHTPPSVTWSAPVPVANASGWNTTAVDFPFSLSGVGTATPESPLHFTGEGVGQTQSVSLTDRDGNVTSVSSPVINIDWSSPSTSAVISSAPGCGEWCSSVEITLSALDNLSGVAKTFYRVDSGAPQTYTSPFSVSSNGTHTVSYWSQDVAGNIESAHSSVVKIDTSAPITQTSTTGTAGGNGWYRSAVQVSLTASDNNQSGVANTYYSVDGGATQTYGSSFSIGAEGLHQVNFWSVDTLGNTESQQSVTIKIDLTGSTVQSSTAGTTAANNFFRSAVQVTLTTADNLSGVASVYYRIDGGATNTYTGTFVVSGDGIHSVEYWSTDVAGNSGASYNIPVKIDMTGPVTQATLSGTLGMNGWYRSTAKVTLVSTDNFNGIYAIYYSIDGGSTKIYSQTFNVSNNGTHVITYWSVDGIMNGEPAKTLSVKVDTNKPDVTATATPNNVLQSSDPVTVTISGHVTDTVSSFQPGSASFVVVDEYGVTQPTGAIVLQANGNYSFTLMLPATKNSGDRSHVYTITVTGSDQAGNTGSDSATVRIN